MKNEELPLSGNFRNGFRRILLMHLGGLEPYGCKIEVDQRPQSDGGNNGADTDRTAKKEADDRYFVFGTLIIIGVLLACAVILWAIFIR